MGEEQHGDVAYVLALDRGWKLTRWTVTREDDDPPEAWSGRQWDVDGRSMEHIDRLVRDLIAHGVSPTKQAGRGVGVRPPCNCDWLDDDAAAERFCAGVRYYRNEARAARVVAR